MPKSNNIYVCNSTAKFENNPLDYLQTELWDGIYNHTKHLSIYVLRIESLEMSLYR
jgi:hypothetical protein